MTLDALAELVATMRRYQREYFAARQQGFPGADALALARQYEKRVDRAVSEILDARQPGLFPGEGPP